ncbi:MAG TPA: tetratricopeptide repeat protein, partial [Candidatus Hydrogenedentes bacterium]|nr:tetratricopeptide repeat protein [Candidatus Hydrogenedentota bacterium]
MHIHGHLCSFRRDAFPWPCPLAHHAPNAAHCGRPLHRATGATAKISAHRRVLGRQSVVVWKPRQTTSSGSDPPPKIMDNVDQCGILCATNLAHGGPVFRDASSAKNDKTGFVPRCAEPPGEGDAMMPLAKRLFLVALTGVFCLSAAHALPEKGTMAPSFVATDIRGNQVDLDAIMAETPDMVVLYFFTRDGGEEIALRLSVIHMLYGRDKVRIIAFGVKEDEEALRQFAEDLGVDYYILSQQAIDAADVYGPLRSLPLTFILKNDKTIVKVVRGSGETAAAVLTKVAETYMMQGKTDEAVVIAEKAAQEGEDAKMATEIKGFAFAAAGKLDEAEEAFGLIDSREGLARVALERGDYTKAVEMGDDANSGYGETIKAMALMRTGKLDEAASAFDAALAKPAEDWQQSEAVTGQGRLLQEKGDSAVAIARYKHAVSLDPYNVVALSNEAAVHRSAGDLEEAAKVLEQAKAAREDELVSVMLRQVQQELKEANDVRRGELIRQQIEDLKNRFQEMKEQGLDKPVDPWSSRPMVLAFLPSENRTSVFFERAGMDVVLRRELESQVHAQGAIQVVEREMLDKLLQELDLGSSELTSQDTQLQLGRVLSAQYLGFVDFTQAGPDTLMYLRLVDTET